MHPTWTEVALALITAIPAIIAAFSAIGAGKKLNTSNGKKIGEMVEEIHNDNNKDKTP